MNINQFLFASERHSTEINMNGNRTIIKQQDHKMFKEVDVSMQSYFAFYVIAVIILNLHMDDGTAAMSEKCEVKMV